MMDKESRKCYINYITNTGTPIWIRDKISNTIHPMKKHISPNTTHNHQSTNKRYCYLLTQTPETVFLDYIFSSYNHPFSNQETSPKNGSCCFNHGQPTQEQFCFFIHNQTCHSKGHLWCSLQSPALWEKDLFLHRQGYPVGKGPFDSLFCDASLRVY